MDWKVDGEIVGLTALVAADVAAFLSGMNPSFFTMRAFADQGGEKAENTKKDVRIGSTVGALLALTAGFGASLVSDSWWPLAASAVTLAIIIGAYEYAINNPHGYGDIGAQ